MPDFLGSVAVALVADLSQLNPGFARALSDAQKAGEGVSRAFGQGTASTGRSLMESTYRLRSMVFMARDFADTWSAVSGMQISAEFERSLRFLERIDGSATNASAAFQKLLGMANASSYDAAEVLDLGVRNAGRLGSALEGARRTSQVLDLATVAGVRRGNFDRFNVNLDQMFNKEQGRVNMVDVRQMLNAAPLLVNEIAKARGVSNAQASKDVYGLTGPQMKDLLLGIADRNQGAAARAASADPFVAVANTGERFRNSMASTGALLNKVLLATLPLLDGVAGGFEWINNKTGGGAGLVMVLGLAAGALGTTVISTVRAVGAIRTLIGAIDRLAWAAGRASAIRGTATVVGAAASGAGSFAGSAAGSAAGTVGGLLALRGTTSLLARVAASRAAPLIAGTAVRGLLSAGASSAAGGAAAASGPVGWIIAGTVIAGMALATYLNARSTERFRPQKAGISEQVPREVFDRLASTMERVASTMTDIKVELIGGGSRGRNAMSAYEKEWAALHLMRTAQTGVG